MFKKLLSSVLSLVLILTMGTTVLATEISSSELNTNSLDEKITNSQPYTFTVNEYDVYVSTRNKTNEQLLKEGYETETIKAIKSNLIEETLLKYSKMPTEELIEKYGYTKEQAQIIKNYDGSPIEKSPELRAILATMTCTVEGISATVGTLSIKFSWDWSNCPILSGPAIKDIVGIRWQGTDTAGQPINLALEFSSCTLHHYNYTGTTYQFSTTASVATDNPYGHAYSKFPMSINGSSSDYVKKGALIVTVSRTGTNHIKEAAFVFGYGHTILSLEPSLSLPVAFGIGFSAGVEKMVEKAVRMTNTGNIISY
ncbi:MULTISPECIES: hypothetical protein [Desulfitobacterium]|uniref:Uncharacterized protein n=1 Tax=Desulfitobacterium dehalogenans (strain ATCC 51507 / DSM 9161 / JW/IU-DC1) TaxID=756499 RepID=I4ABA1_DESDJ|nr:MULTISPECIES: hypothetical protein [Desulfitobacterium]AFM01236.1 hypothetical protein Desde_2934 [Desulfitobacterium dehalogenans ATCC 51507]